MTSTGHLLKDVIQDEIGDVWTTVPGTVTNVHEDELKIDVNFKVKWNDNPIRLYDVRILYPQGNGAKIMYKVSQNDHVLLVFSKYVIDSLQSEGYTNVDVDDVFDVNDVVALPGFTIDADLSDEFHGMPISVPNGVHIVTEGEVIVSSEQFKWHDGETFYDILTSTTGSLGGIDFIASQVEPNLTISQAAVWTKLDAGGTPVSDYFIAKTDRGQYGVELG